MARKTDTQSRTTQQKEDNYRLNSVALVASLVVIGLGVLGAILLDNQGTNSVITGTYFTFLLIIGLYILNALKIAAQWEKVVILRFGKFHALKGPGLFWIMPIMDTVANWIDHRVMVDRKSVV